MFSTHERREMLVLAGGIIGFLVAVGLSNIFGWTTTDRYGWTIVVLVVIGVAAGLILEKVTRRGYQAAFVHGKNPIVAANKKLPSWYTKTRMNRGVYWTFNVIIFAAFIVPSLSVINGAPYPLSSWIVGAFALIWFAARLLLMRFRMNDISPETQIELAKRGGMGLFGGWVIDFAPSSKEKGSSFEKVQAFYLPQGKPNVQNIYLNVRMSLLWVAIIVALFLLLAVLK